MDQPLPPEIFEVFDLFGTSAKGAGFGNSSGGRGCERFSQPGLGMLLEIPRLDKMDAMRAGADLSIHKIGAYREQDLTSVWRHSGPLPPFALPTRRPELFGT